jgi:hypothetical protein
MIVPIWCTRPHRIGFLWCKTSGILSGPDGSCVQMPGLSKKIPSKNIFPAKKSGSKVPGPKKISANQRKTRKKQSIIQHSIDGAQKSLPVSTRPIEPDTLALKCRQPKNSSARNFPGGKIFGLKLLKPENFPVEG